MENVNHVLKEVYDDVRQKLNESHQRNKTGYYEKVALIIGNRV